MISPAKIALEAGEKFYHARKPCKRCGGTLRYTKGQACKTCQKNYSLKRYYEDPQRTKDLYRDWKDRNPGRAAFLVDRWLNRHPERKQVAAITATAIRCGWLVKGPCEKCGDPKVQAHHDDYSKPLEVRWLCVRHHHEHHRVARLEKRGAAEPAEMAEAA